MKTKKITVYTTTRISTPLKLAWFKETLQRFYDCTDGLEEFFTHILIDDSESPYAVKVQAVCAEYGIETYMDFCRKKKVYYAGIWKYILDTCPTNLFMFLLDDIFFIQKQDFISPCILAFEQHPDLYKIQLQCLFSSWTKAGGSPILGTKCFYKIKNEFVETVEGTKLFRYPIDSENTLWKTDLKDEVRGVCEMFSLNPSILRRDILKKYWIPSVHRRFFSKAEERIHRRLLRVIRKPLVMSPAEIELFFYTIDIDQKYNTGYLNMQTFSYTPDHQSTGIGDMEEFKNLNSQRVL